MKNLKLVRTNLFGLIVVTALVSVGYAQVGASISSATVRDGEIIVKNNLIESGNQMIEVEGVCKLTASGATCWKPDGTPNIPLSDTISKSISRMDEASYRFFPVSYKRKYRFLVLKDTRLQRTGNSLRYGEFFTWRNSNGGLPDGWNQNSNALNAASSTGFDGSYTTWTVFEGVFDLETKEFPFRYAYRTTNTRTTTIPVKAGAFEIEGNKYELTSIANAKPIAKKDMPMSGYGYFFDPLTDVTFKAIAPNNPFSFFNLQPADEKGNPINYVTKKGVPVSSEVVQKWANDHQNIRSDERERKSPYVTAGSIYFDAPAYNWTKGSVQPGRLNIAKEYVKTFLVTIGKREVYVFNKVRLDPN